MGFQKSRCLAIAVLVCATACDQVDYVEVARVTTDDRRNRILQILIEHEPNFTDTGTGTETLYAIRVPRQELGPALERLRLYGFDRVAPKPREVGGLFGGAENETTRRAMESERVAAAICQALEVDTNVISAAAVVNLTAPRKTEPRLAEAKEPVRGSIGSASIVVRATLGDAERESKTAQIVAMTQRLLEGQGLDVAGVDVVVVPPLPIATPQPLGTARVEESAAVLPKDSDARSRVLAYSLLANGLCGLGLLFKIIGSLRRRSSARVKNEPIPKSGNANRSTRGAA